MSAFGMKGFDAYFFGRVDPLRPFALRRALLLLLAFDCWLDLVPHGARYGAGAFNVAHFRFLDALLPVPTAALYVGLILFVGWLALTMALAGPPRWGMALLTGLYTFSWSMSMLDSYQHHYLLSWLLFAMTFFPERDVAEVLDAEMHTGMPVLEEGAPEAGAQDDQPPLFTTWAYPLFVVSCAIVYFYTAVTKTNADWRDGHALRRLAENAEGPSKLVRLAADYGVGADAFWNGLAKSAILIQLVIAAGFVCMPSVDRLASVRRRRLAGFWVLAPLSFHLGASAMGLEIGWFTEYMLIVACVVFLPRPILGTLVWLLTLPAQQLGAWWRAQNDEPHAQLSPVMAGLAAVVCGGAASMLMTMTDLPGAEEAAVGVAATSVGLALWRMVAQSVRNGERGDLDASAGLVAGLASLGAAGALLVALVYSPVRFDYYRFAGGDARRRATAEEPTLYLEAVQHYTRAQRYYPYRGQRGADVPRDRQRELDEMQQAVARLRASGGLPTSTDEQD